MYYHDAQESDYISQLVAGKQQGGKGQTKPSSQPTSGGQRTSAVDVINAIATGLLPFAPGGAPTFQPSPQSADPGVVAPQRSSLLTPTLGVVGGVALIGLVVWYLRSKK